jgi:hypothetical protein
MAQEPGPLLRGLIIRVRQDLAPKKRSEEAPFYIAPVELLPEAVRDTLFELGAASITSIGSKGFYKVEFGDTGLFANMEPANYESTLPTIRQRMQFLGELALLESSLQHDDRS